jgi:SAM-dependent methyltransferase
MGTQQNTETYRLLYEKEAAFLRYPADWVLRFKNMFLRERLPHGASILDFGCGSANNSIPFIKDGHKVFGVDVSEAVLPLVAKNLEFHGVPIDLLNNFAVQNPPLTKLGFSDNTFDFILSNQVHYYSRNVDELHTLNQELLRVLKPNGIFFCNNDGTEKLLHHSPHQGSSRERRCL